MKIYWPVIPAFLLSVFFLLTTEVKPPFSIMGVNWMMLLLAILWLTLMFWLPTRGK
jgi:hypothetical protein